MRTTLKAATVLFVCLLANPLFGGDCSDVRSQIGPLKNKPGELRILLDRAPQCGEVWEALGDYFYGKRLWNDAYSHYAEAIKYLPDNAKVSARLRELRPKQTTMIRDEEDMIKWRRRIGGTTDSLPQSFTPAQPSAPSAQTSTPSAQPSAPSTQTSTPSAQPSAPSAQTSTPSAQPSAPSAQPAASPRVRAKASLPAPQIAGAKPPASSKKRAEPKIVVATGSPSSQAEPARAKIDKVALMVHFKYNSSEITPESKKLLDGLAEVLNKELAGRAFVIQGHTDSKGGRDYNLRLSRERAKAVRTYLAQRGVDTTRLSAQGFGFDKPIYDNSTDSGRSKNRRVEFEEK